MAFALCFGLFLPLLSFIILLCSEGQLSRRLVSFLGCSSVFLSFAAFSSLLFLYVQSDYAPYKLTLYNLLSMQNIEANFSLQVDALSLVMALIITGVGFLIHVYSIGYTDHEKGYSRYFCCMNFFIFAILLLVLAADVLFIFAGWEAVGLASYLLIGFWFDRPSAAKAATKAFVVNRIGDLGFLLALLLTFTLFGTGDLSQIFSRLSQASFDNNVLTVLTLLFFIGAIGKSAQLPLHVWLPDAMEGPTPVSALIHAATMVTAGVYLVVRLHPLYDLTPITLQVVAAVGALTSLFAACCAVGQTDLKRVLAYSTVSQLGLMFLACGASAYFAAMFHLTTHAFIKALLFLSAGSVVHMLHGETEMSKMGGLKKQFFYTHWLFLIGALALSGIPPLAAFFSKEMILEQQFLAGKYLLFSIGLGASILTAFYMLRAYCLTFLGPCKAERPEAIQEAPIVMRWPLAVLAFLSIFGGLLGCCTPMPLLKSFLAKIGITLAYLNESLFAPESLLALFGAILAAACSFVLYTKYQAKLGAPWQLLKNAFYVDKLYELLFVIPLKALSRFISQILEIKFFEESISFTALSAKNAASLLQKMQSGQIRSYVAWMMLGSAILLIFVTAVH